MEVSKEFWAGKRVLVTGHTGFKGSWLCLWLTMLGARVTGYALAAQTQPNLFEQADVGRDMLSIVGDVRDMSALHTAFEKSDPQIVMHLAAQSLVRQSYAEPASTYDINVMGTVNVLEAVRACKSVRCVVVVTSDKCYENLEDGVARIESDRLGGRDPYSNSKACAELVTDAYRRTYFASSQSPQIATARAGNVVGGGDWASERLVPDLIRALMCGDCAQIRNPRATRPWQHVLDPLCGYLSLAERAYSTDANVSRAWNFGPQEEGVSVSTIADMLCSLWGEGASWQHVESDSPLHEARTLALNAEAANTHLGWKAKLSVRETIGLTASWYQSYARDVKSARSLTELQIRQFMRRPAP